MDLEELELGHGRLRTEREIIMIHGVLAMHGGVEWRGRWSQCGIQRHMYKERWPIGLMCARECLINAPLILLHSTIVIECNQSNSCFSPSHCPIGRRIVVVLVLVMVVDLLKH